MGNKPTGYDIIQDVNIETAHQFDKDGDSVKPRADRPALELQSKDTAPTTPASGNVKIFVQQTGVSPDELTKVAYKDSDGEEVIIATKIR